MSGKQPTHKRVGQVFFDLLNTLVSLVKVIVTSKKTPVFPQPGSDTCVVLGNGPSLKTSLEKHGTHFQGKSLICVNSFALSPEYVILKPKYCVMLDPGLWKADNDFVAEVMTTLITKTSWPLHLIIPHDAKYSQRILSLSQNPNIIIHYINYVVFKGFDNVAHFFYKKNRAMPQCQNVLVASLFFAINIGYRKIELFGADHNWHEQIEVNDDNVVCVKQVHFYENEQQVKYLPFYKAMHVKETFRMDEAFHAWAKVFYGYFRIRRYAESRNARIINASERSFVDAFERKHP